MEVIAYGTMILTVGAVLSLPRTGLWWRIGPASIAAQGVIVFVFTGIVSPADLVGSFDVLWRPLIAILSIMMTTNMALRLGILDHVAKFLAPRSGQSVQHLFRSVFVFSAATSAVLNNDAAVLLLTPLIVNLIRRCYPQRPDLLVPFAFAVFSAAGVAPIVISNPMNLIVAEYAGIGFNDYAIRMIPISVANWLSTYIVLRIIFNKRINTPDHAVSIFPMGQLSFPAKLFIGLMVLALGAYPILSYANGPVWAVAAVSAILGMWLCWRHGVASPRGLTTSLSWEILIFLFCVFVLVIGLRNVGLADRLEIFYSSINNSENKIVAIGICSAIGSALLNNHPMAILNSLVISRIPDNSHEFIFSALIGGDLGPRLLPAGSLAGLLWLSVLKHNDVYVSTSRFVMIGLPITIPGLALSILILILA